VAEIDWVEIPAGESIVGATEEQKAALIRKIFEFYGNQLDERTRALVEVIRGKLHRRGERLLERIRAGYVPKDAKEILQAGQSGPDALTEEEGKIRKRFGHIFTVEATLEGEAQRVVKLDTFYIARFPVTEGQRAQYRGRNTPSDPKVAYNAATWQEADSICRDIGGRLPTEEEWEKAARGPEGLMYPWGNEWDPERGNFTRSSKRSRAFKSLATLVDAYPDGASPYGVWDMCGNVQEWTMTPYVSVSSPGERWYVLKAYSIKDETEIPWFDHRAFRRGSMEVNEAWYTGFRPARDKWERQSWSGHHVETQVDTVST
jgi:hypothetical protein